MTFGDFISRSDGAALVPEVVSREIIQSLPQSSAALSRFRRVTMSTAQTRMPVLSVLPTAYWVDGDTGLKNQTELQWTNKYLDAAELAAIVPIPEAYLEDTEFDVWGEVRPRLEEAIGNAFDAAIFFGTNKPNVWQATAIVPGAAAASNTANRGAVTAANGGLAGDFSGVFGKVEEDGFDVNAVVAHTSYKGRLRQARDTTGGQLGEVTTGSVFGVPVDYPMRGLWPTAGVSGSVEAIVGDFTQGIVGLRQDIRVKLLDQAVIQGQDGSILLNLPQQDMVALRFTFRGAFQVANPVTLDNTDNVSRYPFATLLCP